MSVSLSIKGSSVALIRVMFLSRFLNSFCDVSLTFCGIIWMFFDMQNPFKIDPKWSPGGACGDPRGLPEAVRAHFQTQLKNNEKINDSGRLPGRPGRLPGTQRDPRNQPKFDFLLKKVRSKRRCLSIFVRKAIFHVFGSIFIVFSGNFDKK